jgi:hypothetical protein
MKLPTSSTHIAIAAITSLSFTVFAPSALANTTSHSAHEHGTAHLTIASGIAGIGISLESPAANIFGFEHKPSSDADHAIVKRVSGILKQGDALFIMDKAASCKLEDVELESSLLEDSEEVHDNSEDSDSTHNDVYAMWRFTCSQAVLIENVDVKIMSAFSEGIGTLNVDWISPSESGSLELKDDGIVTLK